MKYFYDLAELKTIVNKYAKYQKVMHIYDDSVSNGEINDIRTLLKDSCVYNCKQVSSCGDEIYDGYRLLILHMSADSFIHFGYDLSEFISVFIPTDGNIMPYFIASGGKDYLYLTDVVDKNAMPSMYFNFAYSYLNSIIKGDRVNRDFKFDVSELTNAELLPRLENMSFDKYFDIEILRETGISYQDLCIVDYIVISAIFETVQSIMSGNFTLRDVYKICKDDLNKVDKLYQTFFNDRLKYMISLNYNCIVTILSKAKTHILDLMRLDHKIEQSEMEDIFFKLEKFALDTDGIINYSYLINII